MTRYRYLVVGLFLAVSYVFAQRQADNLSGSSQVCLFTNVLSDGKLDSNREEAVLTHMNEVATELGLQVRDAEACQSLIVDTTSDTLKILLTLQTFMLPGGGNAYTYDLLGLLDSVNDFSSASIYRIADFGITAETERGAVLVELLNQGFSLLAADWQSVPRDASQPTEETSQRREGPTPNGGAYSIAYYRDENGNPTTKDQAHSVEIVEYNDKGEAIHSTFGQISPQSH